MPIPESSIVTVELILSGMILMKKFGWASIFSRICHGLVADLVGGIGRIRYELTQKDFFVRVKCVDDQTHQLLNVGNESESLRHGSNI